jgi:HEAT repeat protein
MNRFRSLLAEILRDCGLECVPYAKISALARLCGPSEVAILIEELDRLRDAEIENEPDDVRDEYWRCRIALSQALAEVGEPAVEPLLQALNSPNPQTRSHVARALGVMGAKRAFEPIRDILVREEDNRMKIGLIEALGDLRDERALDVLLPCLKAPAQANRGWIVRVAANALGKIGVERVIQPLAEVLETDCDWFARLGAVEGLRQIRCPRAAEALRRALTDADGRVRREAAVALRELADSRA